MNLASVMEMYAGTDVGRVRHHNEDAVFIQPEAGFVLLADGMGGYNAGEVASGMAIATLAGHLEPLDFGSMPLPELEQQIRRGISRTNQAIIDAAAREAAYLGMGTTLVMGCFVDDHVLVAHVGDSRCYRWRAGQLERLTRDHSLLQEQIDSGLLSEAEARHSLNRNLVTRALGAEPEVEPDVGCHAVLPGDIYLFCSDGLNDMVEEEDMALALQTLAVNLPLAAEQLIQLANDNGGRDNVSVILVRINTSFALPHPWWQRMGAWLK